MPKEAWQYGCIFCRTGAERTVADYINRSLVAFEAVAPLRTRRKTVAGEEIVDVVPLLPGYVFFRVASIEQLARLTRIPYVLRLLEYENLSWELAGRDRDFAAFLFEHNPIQMPQAMFIDGRLHFTDGFLCGHDDAVIRVNRRKRTAEIRLEVEGLTFWIGYDERHDADAHI